ncbi:uncharacterized protein LAJ45_03694 [Morchella importuna]|uniref:uncharacterized protein n=1 Tax=Morchella importuna TaxID=1174673 RepID=UPI001E8CC500|nr:uncharacterized protein LAJ45_03694 [Morchella importuna]KAH8152268.1 hypothetical protein LAJ45_03694 [Morchella importuna]
MLQINKAKESGSFSSLLERCSTSSRATPDEITSFNLPEPLGTLFSSTFTPRTCQFHDRYSCGMPSQITPAPRVGVNPNMFSTPAEAKLSQVIFEAMVPPKPSSGSAEMAACEEVISGSVGMPLNAQA